MVSAVDDDLDVLRLFVPEPIELEPSRTREGAKACVTVGLLTPFLALLCLNRPTIMTGLEIAGNFVCKTQLFIWNSLVFIDIGSVL
jgi:hypothetical protein